MGKHSDRVGIAVFRVVWYAVPLAIWLVGLYGLVRFVKWAWQG